MLALLGLAGAAVFAGRGDETASSISNEATPDQRDRFGNQHGTTWDPMLHFNQQPPPLEMRQLTITNIRERVPFGLYPQWENTLTRQTGAYRHPARDIELPAATAAAIEENRWNFENQGDLPFRGGWGSNNNYRLRWARPLQAMELGMAEVSGPVDTFDHTATEAALSSVLGPGYNSLLAKTDSAYRDDAGRLMSDSGTIVFHHMT